MISPCPTDVTSFLLTSVGIGTYTCRWSIDTSVEETKRPCRKETPRQTRSEETTGIITLLLLLFSSIINTSQ